MADATAKYDATWPQIAVVTLSFTSTYDKAKNESTITVSSWTATQYSRGRFTSAKSEAGTVEISFNNGSWQKYAYVTMGNTDTQWNANDKILYTDSNGLNYNGSKGCKGAYINKNITHTVSHSKNLTVSTPISVRIVGSGAYAYTTSLTTQSTSCTSTVVDTPPSAPSLAFKSAPGFENCLSYQNGTYKVYTGSEINVTMTPGSSGQNVTFQSQYMEYQPEPPKDPIHRFRAIGESRATSPITYENWKPKPTHLGKDSYTVRGVESFKRRNGSTDYSVKDYSFQMLPTPSIPKITKKAKDFQISQESTDSFDIKIDCTGIAQATSPAKIVKYSGHLYEHSQSSVIDKGLYEITEQDQWIHTFENCKPETKYGITVYAHDNFGQKSDKNTQFDVYVTTGSHQAKLWYRVGGKWQLGKVWYKEAGTWQKVKKAYIKDSTGWKKTK